MFIKYHASDFGPHAQSALSGNNNLTVSWADIVWSAITAGKSNAAHLIAHRWHSLADIVVRTHLVHANLQQHGQQIQRSTLYDSLDPTEKGAASYFLGMTMAKLFAAKIFLTPWLFHVSQATSAGAAIKFRNGSKSQPDLIGKTSAGEWIVIEAKGRTNGFNAPALETAKSQTQMIRTINGSNPKFRIALQAFFQDQLAVRLKDPPDADKEAIDIKLDMQSAMSRYYALAAAITAKSQHIERVGNHEYAIADDSDSGLRIGLSVKTLEKVQQQRFAEILIPEEVFTVTPSTENRLQVYPDGLLVELDNRWSESQMLMEPEKRGG